LVLRQLLRDPHFFLLVCKRKNAIFANIFLFIDNGNSDEKNDIKPGAKVWEKLRKLKKKIGRNHKKILKKNGWQNKKRKKANNTSESVLITLSYKKKN
jgi:tRNA nucleotidyltransferase/poly(A) polymerase